MEALAADERSKSHTIFADRIIAQLALKQHDARRPIGLSPSAEASPRLCSEIIPQRRLRELILKSDQREIIDRFVQEQFRSDLLRAHNLEPRNRILLTGPPGNGKTSLSEAIAEALGVPLLVVQYESVIGSFLGETAQRIGQVFAHARTRQCVLFFDEFDAIGKERGDTHETGEIKRVVSSLLLQIDQVPTYVVVIAASNHAELLDRAAWRRFQIRLELTKPNQRQIEQWIAQFQRDCGQYLGVPARTLARNLGGLSFSEVEDFCTDVLRDIILDLPESDPRHIAERSLEQRLNWTMAQRNKSPR